MNIYTSYILLYQFAFFVCVVVVYDEQEIRYGITRLSLNNEHAVYRRAVLILINLIPIVEIFLRRRCIRSVK